MPEARHSCKTAEPSRHPGLVALWLVLAIGYLSASAAGLRVVAMAIVGLMVGALLAVSGRIKTGAVAGTTLAGLCLYFSDSMRFTVYAPPLAAFAFMALFFYRTLRPGQVPLITRVARREHPDLPPDMDQYTRKLTWIWTFCFVLLFAAALVLAPVLTLDLWSRWAQGLGYVLPGALFLGEFAYRHYRFPNRQHGSLWVLFSNIVAVSKELSNVPGKRKVESGR